MAASHMPVQPVAGIRACSTITDANRRKPSSSASWWTPLFGWSSEPDYIDSENNEKGKKNGNTSLASTSDAVPATRSRISPGSFTEEKARKLRLLTTEMESFHDKMYHSAIASRLASDFSDRSNR